MQAIAFEQLPILKEATAFIKEQFNHVQPKIAMILGSGLGVLAEQIIDPIRLDYADIPGWPISTVAGHAGKLVFGKLNGKAVLLMQGRFHFYEGHPIQKLAFPVRVLHLLGVKKLIITSASGGINLSFNAGDIMMLNDHINWVYNNPLIGKNLHNFGTRFIDTSTTYTPRLQEITRKAAKAHNIKLQEGTYLFTTGPSYETPAEVRMMRTLGADTCGMSTVPEAITATHCGMEVLGITYVSNMAAGVMNEQLDHAHVMETMKLVKDDLIKLINAVIEKI